MDIKGLLRGSVTNEFAKNYSNNRSRIRWHFLAISRTAIAWDWENKVSALLGLLFGISKPRHQCTRHKFAGKNIFDLSATEEPAVVEFKPLICSH